MNISRKKIATFVFSVSILGGVIIARFFYASFTRSPIMVVLSVVSFFVAIRLRLNGIYKVYVLMALSGCLLGVYRGSLVMVDRQLIQTYLGTITVVNGNVAFDPTIDAKGQMNVVVEDIMINNVTYRGAMRLVLKPDKSIKRGEILTLKGSVSETRGTYIAAMYRPVIVTRSTGFSKSLAEKVRGWFGAGAYRSIGEKHAGLGLGFLTGQTGGITSELEQQLRLIGLSHIIVASGYNLTVIVELVKKNGRRLSRFTATSGAVGVTFGFMVVTGFSPSMVRAGIVSLLSIGAWYYGRQLRPLMVIVVSAALSVLLKPEYLWGDIGWYLSFLSFMGVLVVGPLIRDYFFNDVGSEKTVLELCIETFSAQIMTLPFSVFIFGTFSPLALFANIAVLPTIPWAMVATAVAGVAGALLPTSVAHVLGLPAVVLLEYVSRVSAWFASSPYAAGTLHMNSKVLIGSYVTLFLCFIYMYKKTQQFSTVVLI